MKKKLLVIFLAIVSTFALAFGLTACGGNGGGGGNTEQGGGNDGGNTQKQPEKTSGSEGLEYTLSYDGEYYICSGIGTCTQTEIAIASWYNEKYVTGIGISVFKNCSSLTSVTIPDSVTSIGKYAFKNCSRLTSITIPDGLTSIGSSAFYNCRSLTSITIPDSVTSIGDHAFYDCRSLTSITIPDSVESIGGGAFYNCTGLTEINYNATECADLSNNDYVFAYAGQSGTGITVKIGANVKKIPAYLFYPYSDSSYAPKITSVVFEEGSVCESIGNSAFRSCSSLTNVTIPDSVTSIGIEAFSGCSSLTNVTIPDSVTSIGIEAFYSCSSLTSVTIPDSVTSIGNRAFGSCSRLTSITIPDSVTSIGEYAFSYCYSLTSITIPDSVTSIGAGAFYLCVKLIEVKNLSSLTITAGSTDNGNVGYYAKRVYTEGVSYLSTDENGYIIYNDGTDKILVGYVGKETELVLPNDIPQIYKYAFGSCRSLTSITIPDSVESIGAYAFYNCTGLTKINYNATECADLGSSNYVFYKAGQSGTGITVTIGANVKKIPAYLFYPDYDSSYAPKIMSVVFEDGSLCESIGSSAFENCSRLTSITIPDGLTSIGSSAFYNCRSLTSITIPDSVTSISNSAFSVCSSLASVTIPDSVTSIGRDAFSGCRSLTSVTFKNTSGWWRSSSSTATSGTSISSTDLANTSTAAEYLRSTYDNDYWKRG